PILDVFPYFTGEEEQLEKYNVLETSAPKATFEEEEDDEELDDLQELDNLATEETEEELVEQDIEEEE
ncbi:MAG: hypothetical protein ABIW77_04190, partial [Gelidibacter sp.]